MTKRRKNIGPEIVKQALTNHTEVLRQLILAHGREVTFRRLSWFVTILTWAIIAYLFTR